MPVYVLYTYIRVLCPCVYAVMHIYMFICPCMCARCMHVYMFISLCMCVCVHVKSVGSVRFFNEPGMNSKCLPGRPEFPLGVCSLRNERV